MSERKSRHPDEEEPKGFRVVDRRSFASAASIPPERPASAAPPPRAEPQPAPPPRQAEPPRAASEASSQWQQAAGLPEVDFSTFLLSLSTSVLYHLGMVEEDDGSVPEPNLPLAKQSIDILGLLQSKTRGNLTPDEANLLQNLLHDLRLRFVAVAPRR
jgi:hypothetical protein